MNNELTTTSPVNASLSIWNDQKKVRELFAPDLNEKEFEFFLTLGMGLQANPFTREIWAVKYDKSKPANVFLGRDFYRRKAQEQQEYDGHYADAVYENDVFSVRNGNPDHTYKLTNRGRLIGAYCVVYRKNTSKPFYVFVNLSEYDRGFSLWKTMKQSMIIKVAEAQGLRGAFQGIFAGTYDESEQWELDKQKEVTPRKALAEAKERVSHETQIKSEDEAQVEVADLGNMSTGNGKISEAQLKRLMSISGESGVTDEMIKYFIRKKYNIESKKDISTINYDDVVEFAENTDKKANEFFSDEIGEMAKTEFKGDVDAIKDRFESVTGFKSRHGCRTMEIKDIFTKFERYYKEIKGQTALYKL